MKKDSTEIGLLTALLHCMGTVEAVGSAVFFSSERLDLDLDFALWDHEQPR